MMPDVLQRNTPMRPQRRWLVDIYEKKSTFIYAICIQNKDALNSSCACGERLCSSVLSVKRCVSIDYICSGTEPKLKALGHGPGNLPVNIR
jgi:hypothetical protein